MEVVTPRLCSRCRCASLRTLCCPRLSHASGSSLGLAIAAVGWKGKLWCVARAIVTGWFESVDKTFDPGLGCWGIRKRIELFTFVYFFLRRRLRTWTKLEIQGSHRSQHIRSRREAGKTGSPEVVIGG